MGASRVGKTSIISRFLYDKFRTSYKETVDDFHRTEYEIAGTPLTLDIQDTTGSHEFPAMTELSISNGDAFVLVFDVTDEASFNEVASLREKIMDIKNDSTVPIVIVGNKMDNLERVLEREHVENTTRSEWGHGYIECSAKDNDNVLEVFKELLVQAKIPFPVNDELRRHRGSLPLSPKSKRALHSQASCIIS